MEKTLFENSENMIAKSYCDQVRKGEFIKHNVELKSKTQKERYDSFIDTVIESRPMEFYQNSFEKVNDSTAYATLIIMSIFPKEKHKEIFNELEDFLSNSYISQANEILSGVHMEVENTDTKEVSTIVELPSIDNLSSVISIVHEFIHYHIAKYNIPLEKKYYYNEILSIYAEKVAVQLLTEMGLQPDLERKIEQTRLEGIKWHYVDRLEDEQQLIALFETSKSAKDKNLMQKALFNQLSEEYPFLTTHQGRMDHKMYKDALAESYGFGYIYGEALNHYDLEDPTRTRKKISQVLMGDLGIKDLLKYYEIGLNDHTIDLAKEKVKQMTK